MFGFGGRDIAERFEKATIVKPVDPLKGGKFHGLDVAPGASPMDGLSLEQAVDRLGESIFVAIADAPDRRLDASFGELLGVTNRDVSRSMIAMTNEPAASEGAPIVRRLFEGNEDEAGLGRARNAPADDVSKIREP